MLEKIIESVSAKLKVYSATARDPPKDYFRDKIKMGGTTYLVLISPTVEDHKDQILNSVKTQINNQ